MHNVEAFLPNRRATLHAAKLSTEESIESVEVMLSPANARATHYARETLLIDTDGVLDQGKVDVGDLEDVKRQITLEDTSPTKRSQRANISLSDRG